METITNYKLKDFLLLEDSEIISNYLAILELLNPAKEVEDPVYIGFPRIKIKPVRSVLFGEVTRIRMYLNEGNIEALCEAVKLVTGLKTDEVYQLPIIDFFGIISSIRRDIELLTNMEINGLVSEDFDPIMMQVNASERMEKFGTLNLINSLAGGDLTKWEQIEKMPYMVVYTKLLMDKITNDINREVRAIQEQKTRISNA